MKRILLITFIFLMTLQSVQAKDTDYSRTNAKTCTNPQVSEIFKRNYAHRAISYNAINLTDQQIAQREIIDAKRFDELSGYFEKLDVEVFELRKLRACNAKKSQIKKQKKTVKNLQKSINKIDKKYDEEFQKCLTKFQKNKYHDIQRLHRRDIMLKIEDADLKYYDENMPVFGRG